MNKYILIALFASLGLAGCEKEEDVENCPTIKDKYAKVIDLNIDSWTYYFKLSTGEVVEVDKKTYYEMNYTYNSIYTPKCSK